MDRGLSIPAWDQHPVNPFATIALLSTWLPFGALVVMILLR